MFADGGIWGEPVTVAQAENGVFHSFSAVLLADGTLSVIANQKDDGGESVANLIQCDVNPYPALTLDAAEYDELTLVPGEELEVTLSVSNTGARAAQGLRASGSQRPEGRRDEQKKPQQQPQQAQQPKAEAPKAEKKPEAPKAEKPRKEKKAEPAKAPKAPKEPKEVKAPVQKEYTPAEAGSVEEKIETFLKGLLEHMDSKAVPHAWKDGENTYKVDLVGDDLGFLIGRRGDTLDAIQHLANYTVNREVEGHIRINVDAEAYRQKREDSLRRYARKKAQQVLKARRRTTLEPMNAYERHVIHATLQDMDRITTYSVGTEPNRRVVIEYVR